MSILAAEPNMTIAEKQHRTIKWANRVLTCESSRSTPTAAYC